MRSMTGFGKARVPARQALLDVEIRSVNHRYFKFKASLPDALAPYEAEIEDLVRAEVRRGTVQVTVEIETAKGAAVPRLNVAALKAYQEQIRRAKARLRLEGDVPLSLLLTLPQVWSLNGAAGKDGARWWPFAKRGLQRAVADLLKARAREGRGIQRDCLRALDGMDAAVRSIRARAPDVVREYQAKLRERVQALLADAAAALQPADLQREVAVFADRCDISEELQRLESHLRECRRLVLAGGEAGRRLEFLSQEVLREANTIGVKSNDYAIAGASVNLKAELEKLKEQIENIE